MATMSTYCKIDGMKGDSTDKDHKEWCLVLGFDHTIEYSYDPREDRGRTEPNHLGVTIKKPLDPATPLLMSACATKQEVKEVVVEFTRDKPSGGGTEPYYSVTLNDVRVVKVREVIDEEAETAQKYPHTEEVTFSYREIIWKHLPAKQETDYKFEG